MDLVLPTRLSVAAAPLEELSDWSIDEDDCLPRLASSSVASVMTSSACKSSSWVEMLAAVVHECGGDGPQFPQALRSLLSLMCNSLSWCGGALRLGRDRGARSSAVEDLLFRATAATPDSFHPVALIRFLLSVGSPVEPRFWGGFSTLFVSSIRRLSCRSFMPFLFVVVMLVHTRRLRFLPAFATLAIPLLEAFLANTWDTNIRRRTVFRSLALVILLQLTRHIMMQNVFDIGTTSRQSNHERLQQAGARKSFLKRASRAARLLQESTMHVDDAHASRLSAEISSGAEGEELHLTLCRTLDHHTHILNRIVEIDSRLCTDDDDKKGVGHRQRWTLRLWGWWKHQVPMVRLFMSDRSFRRVLMDCFCVHPSVELSRRVQGIDLLLNIIEDELCDEVVLSPGNSTAPLHAVSTSSAINAGVVRTAILRRILSDLLTNVSHSSVHQGDDTEALDEEEIRDNLRRALNIWTPPRVDNNHRLADIAVSPVSPDPFAPSALSADTTVQPQSNLVAEELFEADGLGPPLRPPKPDHVDAGFVRLPMLPRELLRQRKPEAFESL